MSAHNYSVPARHLVAITNAIVYKMSKEGLITSFSASFVSKLGDRLLDGQATPKDVEIVLSLFDLYLDPRS